MRATLTFWRWYWLMVAICLCALAFFCTGCSTLGKCERLAIAEELHHHRANCPVYRVHYWWFDMDGITTLTELANRSPAFRSHAINYLRRPDGSRDYYDVGSGEPVEAPKPNTIWYDSYDVRVINGVRHPPQAAPRNRE